MVGRPSDVIASRSWLLRGRGSRATAWSWLWRGDEGGVDAAARWPGRGKRWW